MAARLLAALSSVLLLIVAYLHTLGLPGVRKALAEGQIEGFFGAALPVIWLFFSWHLLVMAVLLLWAALTRPIWFLPAMIFAGAVTLGDFLWVYSVAGWFPGTIGLALALAFAVSAAVVHAKASPSSA